MSKWLLVAIAAFFLIGNRAAYKSYFSDDELDNINWTTQLAPADFALPLVTPKFLAQNFRPVGHLYFAIFGHALGLKFPGYVVPLQLAHLLNILLLWLLARRLGLSEIASAAAALFFGFHIACFDDYWKPMYIFDVFCATFSLASLLFFARRKWILSFVAFWLAYKSKELAVMLPAVMLLYEFWLGKRQWKPLIPFFAVSLSFGLQGLFLNPNVDNDYTFHFTPEAIWTTFQFYSSRVLLFPYLGIAILALPFLVRDRRVWWGVAAMLLFFFPLAFLPGRLFSAYCYVPLIGFAIAIGTVAQYRRPAIVAAFFLIWIPVNYYFLRHDRSEALDIADENRGFVNTAVALPKSYPTIHDFVYDGLPRALHPWGAVAALRLAYHTQDVRLISIETPGAKKVIESESVILLSWDPAARVPFVAASTAQTPKEALIAMNRITPVWQLQDGWYYPLEGRYRWIQPNASAELHHPADARFFSLTANISGDQLRDVGPPKVTVLVDGKEVGSARLAATGWQSVKWEIPPVPEGTARVDIRVEPAYHPSNGDTRALGIAIGSFGFTER